MALEVSRATLLALRLGRTKDAGRLRAEQVSMGKLGNVGAALQVVTYEAAADIHALVVGGALTDIEAFR